MAKSCYIHMNWENGAWKGELSDRDRTICFTGIGALVELLNTEAYAQMEELQHVARTDYLTGLLNRRGVEERLQNWRGDPRGRLALMFLDVDDLKRINDTWGHLRGDRALQKVADILREALDTHDIAGRFGGDEFIAVLRGVRSEDSLRALGEKICGTILREESEIGLSVSLGACWGAPGSDYRELLEQADQAMYQAKREGKNRIALYQG